MDNFQICIQSKYLSGVEQINTLCSMKKIEYYIAMKLNKSLLQTPWMMSETMFNKRKQS